jgi:predicted regulator of Ras-like GTPase activity (Roadblock/LC7/MglB family)
MSVMGTTAATEAVNGILKDLSASSEAIDTVSLTTAEGRNVASTTSDVTVKFKMAALSASSAAIARKALLDLGLGACEEIRIRGASGYLLLFSVGGKGVLTVVARDHANLDSVIRDAKRAAGRLQTIV